MIKNLGDKGTIISRNTQIREAYTIHNVTTSHNIQEISLVDKAFYHHNISNKQRATTAPQIKDFKYSFV